MSMLSAAVVSTQVTVSAKSVLNDKPDLNPNSNRGGVAPDDGNPDRSVSLDERARAAAARADWNRAVVFQLALVQGLREHGPAAAETHWFGAHFRLLRWQLSARDWLGAGDTLDCLLPPLSRAYPRSSAILGWMSLARSLVHYQLGGGGRFRGTLATVIWVSRRRGPRSLCLAAQGFARVERARQRGAGSAPDPVPDLAAGAGRLPDPISPFDSSGDRPRAGWRHLLKLWTGPLTVEDWIDHESRDDDPASLSAEELERIEQWLTDYEADSAVLPTAWRIPWMARCLEAGVPRLLPELRTRLFAAWSGVTARVAEPYAKAVALVALSEIALWCVDSRSREEIGPRVAELRTDLGFAAGLFRRLGLHARAAVCEERWTLLARLRMAPIPGSDATVDPGTEEGGGTADALDAERSPLRSPPSGHVGRALSLSALRRRVASVGFVTHDPSLLRELGRLFVLARSPLPVLVGGESGTGKEVIARAIHQWSGLSGEFVAIHCGAIPKDLLESELFGHTRGAFTGAAGEKPGLVEVADGGTLFLDEIGEMGSEAQMKLLRVLESGEVRRVGDTRVRKVQVRIVAATHRDLPALVTEGEFRLDLYHRIRGVETRLSPLRSRRRDIVPLALHLLRSLRQRSALRISDAAIGRLLACAWPGNVRELKAVLLRAAYLSLAHGSTTIEPESLGLGVSEEVVFPFAGADEDAPDPLDLVTDQVAELGLDTVLERFERRIIAQALDENRWNRTRTAASLGSLSRTTLLSKMKRLGLSEPTE